MVWCTKGLVNFTAGPVMSTGIGLSNDIINLDGKALIKDVIRLAPFQNMPVLKMFFDTTN